MEPSEAPNPDHTQHGRAQPCQWCRRLPAENARAARECVCRGGDTRMAAADEGGASRQVRGVKRDGTDAAARGAEGAGAEGGGGASGANEERGGGTGGVQESAVRGIKPGCFYVLLAETKGDTDYRYGGFAGTGERGALGRVHVAAAAGGRTVGAARGDEPALPRDVRAATAGGPR